jgi:hypothetical protein
MYIEIRSLVDLLANARFVIINPIIGYISAQVGALCENRGTFDKITLSDDCLVDGCIKGFENHNGRIYKIYQRPHLDR